MIFKYLPKINYVFLFLVILGSITVVYNAWAATSATVDITVNVAICGNSTVELGEDCDGANLNGQTCKSQGFDSGDLSCNSDCTFDTSECVKAQDGGGTSHRLIKSAITFTGKAYPKSLITLLKDAQIATIITTDSNGNFSITLDNLLTGTYLFSLIGTDYLSRTSPLFNLYIDIGSGITVKAENILIAPTIAINKKKVQRGDDLSISGITTPFANIEIVVGPNDLIVPVSADSQGHYSYLLNTASLKLNEYFIKARAKTADELISPFSHILYFKIGLEDVIEEDIEIKRGVIFRKGDLNDDARVNLTDFSISAFWYKRPLSEEFKIIEKEMLSGDGWIDLKDFSIMSYYWTG